LRNDDKEIYMVEILKKKRVAMIIAFKDFRDEEYFIPKQILEEAGVKVKTFSDSLGEALGVSGGEAKVDGLIDSLETRGYDAVLFVGGSGAVGYIDNPVCHKIARDTIEMGKVLGAICVAPAILAKAGVLSGEKATVWASLLDKSMVKILEQSGAIYQSDSVVADGKIITASGPDFAEEFVIKIIELL
jgi:protease I